MKMNGTMFAVHGALGPSIFKESLYTGTRYHSSSHPQPKSHRIPVVLARWQWGQRNTWKRIALQCALGGHDEVTKTSCNDPEAACCSVTLSDATSCNAMQCDWIVESLTACPNSWMTWICWCPNQHHLRSTLFQHPSAAVLQIQIANVFGQTQFWPTRLPRRSVLRIWEYILYYMTSRIWV